MSDPSEIKASALILVPTAALLAPVLAYQARRWIDVPTVVFEIALGVLIGPSVLHWVDPNSSFLQTLSQFGLAMLIFLAGFEINFADLSGGPLRRAGIAWGVSLLAAVAVAALLPDSITTSPFVGVALTTTALGTVLPVLRDSGELGTRFGALVTATGAVGEFAPIVAISLLPTERSSVKSALVLAFFGVLTLGALRWARRPRNPVLGRLIEATLRTSGQFAVRLVVTVLSLMVALAYLLQLDILLGAFAAGVVCRLLLREVPESQAQWIDAKLEGLGFGYLVPVFFVVSGLNFDLDALLDGGTALLLLPLFLLLMLLLRGTAAALTAPGPLPRRDRVGLGLYAATGLPLIVAITTIETQAGSLSDAGAAALVGAGMLSVLLFPLAASTVRGTANPAAADAESW
ncbi:cation:proton antiporter [Streptacidiphilus sp. N1-12]|uniref:Cation:proton antiporter n=2 Tax=Streptacidiphilus alkalitolerans TaxID=3342712 RepID=A0ABV6VHI8_9ACTN